MIQVYTKPRGGQRAYKGLVITLPQDVQQLADVLPQCPQDIPIIVFRFEGKNNKSKELRVRKQKVFGCFKNGLQITMKMESLITFCIMMLS